MSGLNQEWVLNEYSTFSVYGIENLWFHLNTEFNKIRSVEPGVLMDDLEEYIWDTDLARKMVQNIETAAKIKIPSVRKEA